MLYNKYYNCIAVICLTLDIVDNLLGKYLKGNSSN